MAAKTGRPIIRTARAICRIGIDGIASKYWNRLRQEVDRGFDRSDNAAGEGFGSDGGEGFSEKCADPQDKELTREVRRLAALNAPVSGNDYRPVSDNNSASPFTVSSQGTTSGNSIGRPWPGWVSSRGLSAATSLSRIETRTPSFFAEQRGWSAAEIEVFFADDAGRPIPRK
jgi:hypothetical protein